MMAEDPMEGWIQWRVPWKDVDTSILKDVRV